jgi:hypothetical protein
VNLLLRVGFRVLSRPSGAAAGAPGPLALSKIAYDRLTTSEESDASLASALSADLGYSVDVATYTGAFELRKLQLSFSRTSTDPLGDDVAVCTFHLAKLASGAVTDSWLAADFASVASAVDAFWASMKVWYPTNVTLKSIKMYKAGPSVAPPQTPVYSADRAVTGTSGAAMLPPQVAITVTEVAGSKPYWGRFYMPAWGYGSFSGQVTLTASGRPHTTAITALADAADTMYESLQTASLPVVVYRQSLPVRTRKDGVELAARSASAWTVDTLQVDDVYDVMRSRRWDRPTLRLQRTVG